MSPLVKDLLKKLLSRNIHERLGAIGGATEIKNHKWFHDIDWDKVYKRYFLFLITNLLENYQHKNLK